MANKFIIIFKDGQLTKKTVRKPDAPRPRDKWHVIHTYAPSYSRVLKTFDEQTAAEMYLLTKGLT